MPVKYRHSLSIYHSKTSQAGFSLIEMVIGITTFAVALTIVTSVISPQITKTSTPLNQVRATELSQSLFNEILGKLYDETSDRNGGRIRCDEDLDGDNQLTSSGERACSTTLGPDGEASRAEYDDVDDYNGYTQSNVLENSLSQNLVLPDGSNLYTGYGVSVSVFYDSDMDGIPNNLEVPAQNATGNTKLVRIIVTTPDGSNVKFTTFKHNY